MNLTTMTESVRYFPLNAPGDMHLKMNLMAAGLTQEYFTTVRGYEKELVDLENTVLYAEREFDLQNQKLKYSLFYKGILIAETILNKNERKMVIHENTFWFVENLLTDQSAADALRTLTSAISAVLESLDLSTPTTRPLRVQAPKEQPETYCGFKPGFLRGKRF